MSRRRCPQISDGKVFHRPDGYITGRAAGDIIVRELTDARLKRYGDNYKTLFSLIRTQTPIIDNGLSGRRKKNYYKEEDVRGLCRTFIEQMREVFEEETENG